jgi:hypothetical protein
MLVYGEVYLSPVIANVRFFNRYFINTYTYPKNEKPAKLEYTASGRWTAIPIDETKEIVPRGEIDADGYTGFESNPSKPCRDYNTGALVVKKNNNDCMAVGRTGQNLSSI